MKDEGRRMKGCPARQISGVNFARGKIHALLSLFASMTTRSALPSFFAEFFGSGFSDGLRRCWVVASAGIKDEDGAVFAGDLDRLAGFGALVEQVEARLRIVVWNPFADVRAQRSHRAAVVLFVAGEEIVPDMVNDLPEG